MAEPTTAAAGSVLGLKYAYLVAGFFGGIVSLSYVKELTRVQALIAVFNASVFSVYCTPFVLKHFSPGPELEYFAAFILGLCAIHIVPGILKLAQMWRKSPSWPPTTGKGSQ